MKKVPVIPEIYEQDYPPKVFCFTGEWSCQPKYSSRNVARRNNPNVWLPIFKADDGQIVCLTWLKSEICPTKRAPDAATASAHECFFSPDKYGVLWCVICNARK